MCAKKVTEIVVEIETERMMIVRSRNKSWQLWCEVCGERTEMTTPARAAQLAGLSQRTIFRRIEKGHLHFVEIDSATLLVCLNSIRGLPENDTG